MRKRLFDWLVSSIGLVVLSPMLLVVAILIRLDSNGPVLFRQERVGRHGKIFRIHKFRTMWMNSNREGLLITVGEDLRVTRVGFWLRKYKLDELPQLIDVLLGHMSFVGPRPEVPHYVSFYPDGLRELVLSVRPGITDNASIQFKDENEILGRSLDPEREYIQEILPIKLRYYCEYVRNRSFVGDLAIIVKTLMALVR